MPVVAFTVGSLGDITSVLQLVWQLRAALHDATGASAEITTLTADLDEFARALLEIRAVLERRRAELQQGVLNGVSYALSRCVQLLQAVQRKIASFRTRIVGAVGAAAWLAYWAVAAWTVLGGKAEVQSLRSRLFEQLDVIRVYLAVSQCNYQTLLHETMQLQRASIDRLFGIMQDIQARFDVGVPPFLFSSRRKGKDFIYHPCARTSARRFYEFCYAYTGNAVFAGQVSAEVAPQENTYLTAAYVREHVFPRLSQCKDEFDMLGLLENAPKLSGEKRRRASNFWIGPTANPLIDPKSPWLFKFGHDDPDVALPLLL